MSHVISLSQSAAVGSREGVMRALRVLDSVSVNQAGRVIAARTKEVSFSPECEDFNTINVVRSQNYQFGDIFYVPFCQQIHEKNKTNNVLLCLSVLSDSPILSLALMGFADNKNHQT